VSLAPIGAEARTAAAEAGARELLARFGLAERPATIDRLSGGQQRRVAIVEPSRWIQMSSSSTNHERAR
jgi:ABC-type polar amino acid transport system ATPase subunit